MLRCMRFDALRRSSCLSFMRPSANACSSDELRATRRLRRAIRPPAVRRFGSLNPLPRRSFPRFALAVSLTRALDAKGTAAHAAAGLPRAPLLGRRKMGPSQRRSRWQVPATILAAQSATHLVAPQPAAGASPHHRRAASLPVTKALGRCLCGGHLLAGGGPDYPEGSTHEPKMMTEPPLAHRTGLTRSMGRL